MGVRRNGAAQLTFALVACAALVLACGPRERVVDVRAAKHIIPVASGSWRIASKQPADGITGYADQTDVAPGGFVHFFVSTHAASYTAAAYRRMRLSPRRRTPSSRSGRSRSPSARRAGPKVSTCSY
jgi:hypothetical protein